MAINTALSVTPLLPSPALWHPLPPPLGPSCHQSRKHRPVLLLSFPHPGLGSLAASWAICLSLKWRCRCCPSRRPPPGWPSQDRQRPLCSPSRHCLGVKGVLPDLSEPSCLEWHGSGVTRARTASQKSPCFGCLALDVLLLGVWSQEKLGGARGRHLGCTRVRGSGVDLVVWLTTTPHSHPPRRRFMYTQAASSCCSCIAASLTSSRQDNGGISR